MREREVCDMPAAPLEDPPPEQTEEQALCHSIPDAVCEEHRHDCGSCPGYTPPTRGARA